MADFIHFTFSQNRLDYNIIAVQQCTQCNECNIEPSPSPSPIYCFEKTLEGPIDCVNYLCASGVPEGETGWTQVGGPYQDECENCGGSCINYTEWKITDQDDYIYAKGPIEYGEAWVGYPTYGGVLQDFPSSFEPLHYGTAGEKNFSLQVKYDTDSWHTMEEWVATIELCDNIDARYPIHYITGGLAPQDPCDFERNNDGIIVCDSNGSFQPCYGLYGSYPEGNGQAWHDPQPGVAYKFTGSSDGEYTNLSNWEDSSGLSPASDLPSGGDIMIVGSLTSVPSDYTIPSFDNVTVSGCDLSVSLTCNNFNSFSSTIGPSKPAGCNTPDDKTRITCDNATIDDGYLYDWGIIIGNAIFDHGAEVYGKVEGDAEFKNGSRLTNVSGGIFGNATFRNNSYSSGSSIYGLAKYYDTSTNMADCEGGAEFYNSSKNLGGVVPGSAMTFYDSSENDTDFYSSNANFYNSSKNKGNISTTDPYPPNTVYTVYFNDSSENTTSGIITGNAVFNNSSKNSGSVSDTATFTDSACNDSGTASTFVPDPPPSC